MGHCANNKYIKHKKCIKGKKIFKFICYVKVREQKHKNKLELQDVFTMLKV